MRHLESSACYFLAGSLTAHGLPMCKSGRMYRELAYVISFAPYYWRAMQVNMVTTKDSNFDSFRSELTRVFCYLSSVQGDGSKSLT